MKRALTLLSAALVLSAPASATRLDYVMLHGITSASDQFTNHSGNHYAAIPLNVNTTPGGTSSELWSPKEWLYYQQQALAPKHQLGQIITTDLPGVLTKSVPIKDHTLTNFDLVRQDFQNKGAAFGQQPYVLIGHSQGGLRSRYYQQYYATPTERQNLKGLITVGSPNYGAPIVLNAPGLLNRITIDIALASFGILNVAGEIFFGGGTATQHVSAFMPDGAYPGTSMESALPGTMDMSPYSSFMDSLNDFGYRDRCVTINIGWIKTFCYPESYRKQNTLISPDVVTGNVVGTAWDTSRAFTAAPTVRWAVGGTAAAATVFWGALAIPTFGGTLANAAGAADLVYIMANADNLLADAAGGAPTDLIVPVANQNMLTRDATGLVGRQHNVWNSDSAHGADGNYRKNVADYDGGRVNNYSFGHAETRSYEMMVALKDTQIQIP